MMEDVLFEVIDGPGCWHAFNVGDIVYPLQPLHQGWFSAMFRVKYGDYKGQQILHATQVRAFNISLENK